MNAALILDIFFAILIGMILGLTVLTANLRGPLEKFMVYIFFFWESKSMRTLLKKNLMAHKATNKLTAMIYALTLGCVLFLCVGLNLVIESVTGLISIKGADIYIKHGYMNAKDLDQIFYQYTDKIRDFSLKTRTNEKEPENIVMHP